MNSPNEFAKRIRKGGLSYSFRTHHVGRLLGHLGAGDAHGDADGRLLERRRVVDAVSGHGGHLRVTRGSEGR